MKTLKTNLLVIAVVFIFGSNANATGFSFSQARAAGMGMAYSALATGTHAAAWNPANLAALEGPRMEIGIIGIGTHFGNDGISYGDFIDWVDDEVLTTAEIQKAANSFSGGSLSLHTNTELGSTPLNFVFDRYALSFSTVVMGEVGVPRGIVDLIADDRDFATQYQEASTTGTPRQVSGVKADAWVLGKLGFSHARLIDVPMFDRFAAGMTLNWYGASPRVRVVESTGDILVRNTGWETETAKAVIEFGGMHINRYDEITLVDGVLDTVRKTEVENDIIGAWGLGFDLGAAGTWNKVWQFSFAIHNIPLRSLTWNTAERRTYELHTSGREINGMSFDDKPDGVETLDYLDTLFAAPGSQVETYEELGSLSATVPVIIRAGVARNFLKDKMTWTMDWEQGFSTSAISSTTPRIASGVEYRTLNGWIPLRAGMSIGGRTGHFASIGWGFHLKWFHWDFALVNEGAFTPLEVLFPGRARGLGFATEMKLAF
jgi:hypothetical protein